MKGNCDKVCKSLVLCLKADSSLESKPDKSLIIRLSELSLGLLDNRMPKTDPEEIMALYDYFFDSVFQKKSLNSFQIPLTIDQKIANKVIADVLKIKKTSFNNRNAFFLYIRDIAEKNSRLFSSSDESYRSICELIRIAITKSEKTPDLFVCSKVLGPRKFLSRLEQSSDYFSRNGKIFRYHLSLEARTLLKKIECWYLDHRLTSKQYVKNNFQDPMDYKCLFVTTCLRSEIYALNPNPGEINGAHIKGKLALRRLISVSLGMQSELMGEKEIILQIEDSLEKSSLEENERLTFRNIINICRSIREDLNININDNYSSIGYKVICEKIRHNNVPTFLVIGGGYMAESFLESIKTSDIKLIWANRDLKKIKGKLKRYPRLAQSTIFCPFDKIFEYLPLADAVFVAINGRPGLINDENFIRSNHKPYIVDVSYPQAVDLKEYGSLVNIYNTDFSKYISEPLTKESLNNINNFIDQKTEYIWSHLI